MGVPCGMGTLTRMAIKTIVLRSDSVEHRASVADDGSVTIDGGAAIQTARFGDGVVRVGDAPTRTAWAIATGDTRLVFLDGQVFEFEVQAKGARRRTGAHGALTAPMPATVLRVQAAPGDSVKRGDTLIILEAMKMELPVRAPADGVVKAVHCRPGDLVQPGIPLIDVEA